MVGKIYVYVKLSSIIIKKIEKNVALSALHFYLLCRPLHTGEGGGGQ